MINNLCHMIDMYRGVATLNKLIIIDGDGKKSVILDILRQYI